MSLGSHQKTVGASQVYLTPKWIIDALGPYDMDPCAADPRPWDCAAANITEAEDGLAAEWHGRVWLNPPFDRYKVGLWIQKLAEHGCGTALLHARTEAKWFRPIWDRAAALLFLDRRITFLRQDGAAHEANSGAPPVLAAFGPHDSDMLTMSGIPGALVTGWRLRPVRASLIAVGG